MTQQELHDKQKALVLASERCVRHPDTYAVRKPKGQS